MTYAQTLDYLYSRLPMFTRVGSAALKPGLKNIIAFCDELGNPQNAYRTIHIGGTNGKGSTSHMLAAILQQAGYKTGLYTSPHLLDFRERIRVNGEMAPESFVVDFVNDNRHLVDAIDPSFFEMTVAMAFEYFKQQKVDVAVIEVGLGGRLDSTNIITPDLSVITNISLDHVNILGSTLEEIAGEKAGIIKKGVPVVIGETHPSSAPVFLKKAALEESPLVFADQHLQVIHPAGAEELLAVDVLAGDGIIFENLLLDLTGTYQQKNLTTVLTAVEILNKQGYKISENHLRAALRQVKTITGLLGRWHKLSDKPLTICDTGHNEAGIAEVLKNIAQTPHQQLHFVIGMVKDKDISKVLLMLPKNAIYYFCAPQLERAMPAAELAEKAMRAGLKGSVHQTVAAAKEAAMKQAGDNDLVFIGGSTFVVAEAI